MIKQAIILAAGMGKRLGKYTQDGTKCMVRVNDRSLIERSLSALEAAGIHRVVLVVGYRAERLIAYLDGKFPDLELIYVTNEIYDKTNNIYSLWLAREYLAAEDSLLLESDLVFEPELIADLVADPEPNLAMVSKFEAWMDGTVTLVGEDRDIVAVVDKRDFKWRNVGDYYKTVNIYKFSAEFSRTYYLPFLDAYLAAFGDNVYYEQVLKVLAFLDNAKLKAHPVSGRHWYEIDDPHDLAVAETIFAPPAQRLANMQARYGGYWRFPGMLDYCYLVNPYFPPERMLDEIKSSFAELVTQYPSGARVQSVLAGKVFGVDPDRVAVGNGAAELIDALAGLWQGRMAIPSPSFNEYPARFGPGRTKVIPTGERLSYTAVGLEAAMTDADILILVNPDNPSGHFMNEAETKGLVDRLLAAGKRVVVDESFADFAEPAIRFSLLDDAFLVGRPGLAVIKSISKSYGVPGFRLGVLASGDADLVDAVRKAVPVWNINSMGEFFLQIVDKYKADYRHACDSLAAERAWLAGKLSGTGRLEVFPSQANYLLCRLTDGTLSRDLAESLLAEHRILIKDLGGKPGFPTGQFIRLAVRGREDNEKLVGALEEAHGGKSRP
ncbi:MAG: aminotransferase [Spirochaetae bacterium HGW-Spirochaetae-3]|jgi:histidinol-phosphate/aromatic aminotransferase/cobyric acid decarboxylase-like protein/GTP:adenosylcobinamide-phosphate guanylyltransferase|nr:MAG: aminotransferase [Spirochaetae bacterium HGW-Spirochaetae-3]